jgi:L-2-hydroxyglutarate oxidase LhgO
MIASQGGEIRLGGEVTDVRETPAGVEIAAGAQQFSARMAVVCAGLQADRLAPRSSSKDFQVMPFLGIHLTPMINGDLAVGPNAVLGWSREGYAKFSVNLRDVASYVAFPRFWKVIGNNLSSGLDEMRDSVFKKSYLEKCRKYCPGLELDDLTPFRAGIRAQAVTRSGRLVHDFLFEQSERVLHVCNAPSPAATSAFPISRMIPQRLLSSSKAPAVKSRASSRGRAPEADPMQPASVSRHRKSRMSPILLTKLSAALRFIALIEREPLRELALQFGFSKRAQHSDGPGQCFRTGKR